MRTSYHHLTPDQRCQSNALNKRGVTQSGITADTGVNQGAIRRELKRNRDFCSYRFLQEHRFTVQRGYPRKRVARVMAPYLIGTGGNITARQLVGLSANLRRTQPLRRHKSQL